MTFQDSKTIDNEGGKYSNLYFIDPTVTSYSNNRNGQKGGSTQYAHLSSNMALHLRLVLKL